MQKDDMIYKQVIYKQDAIEALCSECHGRCIPCDSYPCSEVEAIKAVLPAQPERLTDDDFETIRIHLNAWKEKLCNQRRWKEAEEYQRIIDRFMAFASAQPERKKGQWILISDGYTDCVKCDKCGEVFDVETNFCPNCGADMRGEQNETNVIT